MDDLIAKIRAAIDEDERIAKAAKEVADGYVGDVVPDGGPQGWTDLHCLRQDPDRTLAMVAAHREILKMFSVEDGDLVVKVSGEVLCDDRCIRVVGERTLRALAKGYGIEP